MVARAPLGATILRLRDGDCGRRRAATALGLAARSAAIKRMPWAIAFLTTPRRQQADPDENMCLAIKNSVRARKPRNASTRLMLQRQ
jgi:hypothetical protein